jgi:hypothetical protein
MPTTASAISPLTLRTAVAQFDRFVGAGRGTRRHRGAAHAAVFQRHVHFDGRIASAVENLAGMDVDNRGHGSSFLRERNDIDDRKCL